MPPTPPNRSRRALIEELERRVLLSADVEALVLDPTLLTGRDAAPEPVVDLVADEAEAAIRRSELVFVDARVEGHERWVEDLQASASAKRWIEVIVLDAERDGVVQITEALAARDDLDAIHIISHGSAGQVALGSGVLDAEALATNASSIAGWGDALTTDADLLFYGCELSGDAAGEALVASLAKLTGADVAASSDATGATGLDGDWDLETRSGEIETSLAPSAQFRATWHGTLALETVRDEFSDPSYTGSDGTQSWSGAWQEVGDGGSPGGGSVRVTSNALQIGGDGVDIHNRGAHREADLSSAVSAALSFDYQRQILDDAGGSVRVSVSGDGGSSWTDLATYNLNSTDGSYVGQSFDVTDYIASNTQVRFLGSGSDVDATFSVDNVQIEYGTALGETLYLDGVGDGSDVPQASFKLAAPTDPTLDNFDPARDAFPGLQIAKGGSGADEADPVKVQRWVKSDGGGSIDANVSLTVWSALKDFATDKGGSLTAYLVHCNGPGTSCTEIASATVTRADWDTSDSGTWIEDTLDFGTINTTIPGGHYLGVVLIVDNASGDDLWIAYDSIDTPSRLHIGATAPEIDLDANDSGGVSGSGFAATFVEGGPAVAIADALDATIGDVDSPNLSSLTVTITNLLDSGAELLTADTAGTTIVASYNAGSGVLTLSGTASRTHYEQVLRTIHYQNTADEPDATDRTIQFRANDGANDSNVAHTTVSIDATNDAPTLTVPGAQSTGEDTPLVLSGANAISLSDVDAASGLLEVTLSVTNGLLDLGGISGISVVAGANGSASMTVQGTVADLNKALDGLAYTPGGNYAGGDSISVSVSDLGNTGSGPVGNDSGSVAITVDAENDAPTLTVPGAQSTGEDTPLVLSGANAISLSDVDAAGGLLEVTLSVTNGVLDLASTSGIGFVAGANGSASMTVQGTLANLTVALDGLTYTPGGNYAGADSLAVAVSDLGNTGSGPVGTDSGSVAITVDAENDAPVITVPAAQTTQEDTPLVLAGANAIQVSDVDAAGGLLELSLSVTNGVLDLGATGGIGFVAGANGGASMTLQATLADLNAALDGLTYTPGSNYAGNDSVAVSVSDLGNTGSGPVGTASRALALSVTAMNDAPVATVPGGQSAELGTPLVFSAAGSNAISVSDSDAAGTPVEITLVATNGILGLSSSAGLSFSAGDGTADTLMTFTGNLAAVNAALEGLTFHPTSPGAGSVHVLASDLGNTGGGALGIVSRDIAISIGVPAVDELDDPDDDNDPEPEPETTGEPEPTPAPDLVPIPVQEPDTTHDPAPTLRTPNGQEEAARREHRVLSGGGGLPAVGLGLVSERPEARGDDDADPERPHALSTVVSPRFLEDLETVRRRILGQVADAEREGQMYLFAAEGLAFVASAGVVAALLERTSLAAAVLTSLPVWRRIDPLAVLILSSEERRKREEELRKARANEDAASQAVGRLLDGSAPGSEAD